MNPSLWQSGEETLGYFPFCLCLCVVQCRKTLPRWREPFKASLLKKQQIVLKLVFNASRPPSSLLARGTPTGKQLGGPPRRAAPARISSEILKFHFFGRLRAG